MRFPDASHLLAQLQSSGFRELAGTRVSATIPVARTLVDRFVADALHQTSAAVHNVRKVEVRPHAGDRFDVLIAVTWPFVPTVTIECVVVQQPQFPASPVLVLQWSLLGVVGLIASRLISSLKRLPSGVRLEGDRLSIDIPALLPPGPARDLLPYLKVLQVHTVEDRVVLELAVDMPDY